MIPFRNYIVDEMKDKKNQEMSIDEWQHIHHQEIPTQENQSDCGVFACQFAEYGSRRAPHDFTQQQMPYFRKRMVWEIYCKRLM